MHEDCKAYFEKISEYLDGELYGDLCEKIETHLIECPECQDCFDSLKKTIGLCKKVPGDEIPGDVQKRIRETLKSLLSSP